MKKGFVLLMFIVGGAACTTVVDFDIPLDKPWVVVNSLFSPDSAWQIQVSYSKNILDVAPGSNFLSIRNAVVTIHDPGNLVIETLIGSWDKSNLYSYKGKTKPMPGQSYSVQVSIKDEPIRQAASKVPTHVPITSVEVDSSGVIDGDRIEMKIHFKDPATEKNYYTLKIIEDAFYIVNKDTVWYTQEIFYEVIEQSLSNNGRGLEKLVNDNLFNGKDFTFHVNLYNRRYSRGSQIFQQHVRVVLLSVSEAYYKYFTTKSLQDYTNGDPFAQPVQVFTNVENGLGIFAGYSSSVVELK